MIDTAPTGTPAPAPDGRAVRDAILRTRRSVEEGLVSESDFLRALADRMGTVVVPESPPGLLEAVVEDVSPGFFEEHLLVPFHRGPRGEIWCATAREVHPAQRRELRRALDAPVELVVASREIVEELVGRLYGEEESSALGTGGGGPVDDVEELARQAPVVRLVNFLLREAFHEGASDVHLEAREEELRVRFRVDGTLREVTTPPKRYQAAVVSRIKLLADMDITERRRPQDGRIQMEADGRAVDLRVSTVPTLHGESVVMRILDKDSIRIPLEELGFAPGTLGRFESLVETPHGILLVTGPTGSGKTTTQYAALEKRNAPEMKIVTVEDPVEYRLPGVNQTAVNPGIGLSFASALRSLLRQDPDIIMVGEMRDLETARIAIQAALTGHLVFSTLHTNDAASGITRLLEIGIESYLVPATVSGILAQRLVRTVCEQCAEPVEGAEGEEMLRTVVPPGLDEGDGGGGEGTRLRRGRGCSACDGTGYRGRTGIFELLEMDEGLRAAVHRGASAQTVRRLAREAGMRTLREDGYRKVRRGVTTLEEVLRVTGREEKTEGPGPPRER